MKADFYTFDIRRIISSNILENIKQLDGKFFKEDSNKTDRIKNFIEKRGRILILNDGDKFASFNIYGPLLKLGDFMFIHDYYHQKPSIFDGKATWSDFKDGIKKFELNISNYTKMFKKCLWMCIEKGEK